MSRLVATVTFGRRPAIGSGIEPVAVAHGYAEPMARFLGYNLTDDGTLDRVPGAYAPVLGDRPSVVTDLLLALAPELSSIADRIGTLDTKSRVNYGVDFREKAFDSAVGWGSDGYGRHFEARSQLESHPIDGAVAVACYGSGELCRAIEANLDRLDVDALRG
ncbi:hypothetical protein DM867_07950 [Halosegnis rubeus]|uniref:Uncharacterized protein n=1 Tax=Halosegnis rubeus TaxID=2212850 RepID=A0A5N5U6C0_9EURY|nr:hypothetical protein [Halosegnis rubeus]KAB7513737.1 hypothetical protein DM867_07950 [Halosegnis rubeus]KAB7514140.1 hypothetical protein DMP03_09620 [Halosegnis rubeus]KAB7519012.1 hypothetical protein DP108_07655 [Halosegnis rubeus]